MRCQENPTIPNCITRLLIAQIIKPIPYHDSVRTFNVLSMTLYTVNIITSPYVWTRNQQLTILRKLSTLTTYVRPSRTSIVNVSTNQIVGRMFIQLIPPHG